MEINNDFMGDKITNNGESNELSHLINKELSDLVCSQKPLVDKLQKKMNLRWIEAIILTGSFIILFLVFLHIFTPVRIWDVASVIFQIVFTILMAVILFNFIILGFALIGAKAKGADKAIISSGNPWEEKSPNKKTPEGKNLRLMSIVVLVTSVLTIVVFITIAAFIDTVGTIIAFSIALSSVIVVYLPIKIILRNKRKENEKLEMLEMDQPKKENDNLIVVNESKNYLKKLIENDRLLSKDLDGIFFLMVLIIAYLRMVDNNSIQKHRKWVFGKLDGITSTKNNFLTIQILVNEIFKLNALRLTKIELIALDEEIKSTIEVIHNSIEFNTLFESTYQRIILVLNYN